MPRGVPKSGFRRTKKRMRLGLVDAPAPVPALRVSTETPDQVRTKLKDRFDALEKMAMATGRGMSRSLIVSGPAGLGKSWMVEKKMEELEKKGHHITYIRGYVRPLSLYQLLYNARFPGSVIVFDDSDSVFSDDVSVNLLKVACDTTSTRVLHWLSKSVSTMEDEDGESLPEKFEFDGSIIFITNMDFDDLISRGSKMAPHFEALVSRSHYLDLQMKTKLDYMIRIEQVVTDCGMLRNMGFSSAEETELMDFITQNTDNFRELSLRMVVKVANLMRMDRSGWQKLARQTCFRNVGA